MNLRDIYFDRLEAEGVDFIEYNTLPDGSIESFVREPYASVELGKCQRCDDVFEKDELRNGFCDYCINEVEIGMGEVWK